MPHLRRSPALGPALAALLAAGCNEAGPSASPSDSARPQPPAIPGKPELPAGLLPSPSSAPPTAPTPAERPLSEFPKPPADHKGEWFAVTSPAAGVYSEASFERSAKLGWVRSGGRLPVQGPAVSKKGCTPGWYEVTGGGFICGNYGTTKLDTPDVKFATVAPNLNEPLPYVYASNAKHGTPLYKTVPSREQMLKYEPYLEKKDEPDGGTSPARPAPSEPVTARPLTETASVAADAGLALLDPGMADAGIGVEDEKEKPWWQQENIKDRLHEVKLEHLEADSDDLLARRMVKGFYVAVDRTFRWNERTWYKTTKGLVAPADRFWVASASKFQGVALDGAALKLPIAWGYGGRKQVATYRIDEKQALTNDKSLDRFAPVALTGKSQEIAKTKYLETADGTWLKSAHVRVTEPGPLPKDLAPGERWIDVDISSQTVVAFVGDRPVYATLISTGKHNKDKEKDHSTPTGEWRIREKHVTTTMDGDGTAAGDLPYSIEDVPYVQFFHKAYALHGAFWHGNYGVQMSHGCVNLSPLDAKWLFFFTNPTLPAGFHGAWSRGDNAGTRIVVHD
jgi:lipoprotein-anchoring transpeptidase ErfK/SrfK